MRQLWCTLQKWLAFDIRHKSEIWHNIFDTHIETVTKWIMSPVLLAYRLNIPNYKYGSYDFFHIFFSTSLFGSDKMGQPSWSIGWGLDHRILGGGFASGVQVNLGCMSSLIIPVPTGWPNLANTCAQRWPKTPFAIIYIFYFFVNPSIVQYIQWPKKRIPKLYKRLSIPVNESQLSVCVQYKCIAFNPLSQIELAFSTPQINCISPDRQCGTNQINVLSTRGCYPQYALGHIVIHNVSSQIGSLDVCDLNNGIRIVINNIWLCSYTNMIYWSNNALGSIYQFKLLGTVPSPYMYII